MDAVLDEVIEVDDLHKGEYDPAALAVTFSSLSSEISDVYTRGWFDDWTDVECADSAQRHADRSSVFNSSFISGCVNQFEEGRKGIRP